MHERLIGIVLNADDATIEDRVSFKKTPAMGRLYHHKLDPPPLQHSKSLENRYKVPRGRRVRSGSTSSIHRSSRGKPLRVCVCKRGERERK